MASIQTAELVSSIFNEMLEDYLNGRPAIQEYGICREVSTRAHARCGRVSDLGGTYPNLSALFAMTHNCSYLGPYGEFNEARFNALCWLCALSPQDLLDLGVVE